jgi:hypothetical protein
MASGGTREDLSMVSTVTNRGRAHWMIVDGAFMSMVFQFPPPRGNLNFPTRLGTVVVERSDQACLELFLETV